MKRQYSLFSVLLFFMILAVALIADASDVASTKHNLSASGPGTIKTSDSGVTEVCVFCHTPHSAKADAPLWNRSVNVSGSYSVYASDVLSALTYPSPEDPSSSAAPGSSVHVKTRICLSCHDGTIALGNLVNLPNGFFGDIAMSGTPDGKMPSTAAGYLGIDLSDDHPVAVKYVSTGAGSDPELANPQPTDDRLKLYSPDGGTNNYVECTTCHNPHDNLYGNFLVMSNRKSDLCRGCHGKTGYTGSIHETIASPSASYQPPDGTSTGVLGTYVGGADGVQCMNCHFPHKAATPSGQTPAVNTNPKAGYYLLSLSEEQSCFNNTNRWGQTNISACHGINASAVNARIEYLVNGSKTFYHPVGNWSGQHEATEARSTMPPASAWLGSGNPKWHVECADCHNPHTAGNTIHTPGGINGNAIASTSPLYGVQGVVPGTYPLWPAGAGSYSVPAANEGAGVTNNSVTSAQYEYQICLKCHSDFAWGGSPPTVTINNTATPSLPLPLTNQAMEFGNNPAPPSTSAHPVIFQTANTQFSAAYNAPWTNIGNQTMYCSDCHANDTAPPNGPHGSSNRAILKKTFDPGTAMTSATTDFCYDCHRHTTYYLGSDPITNTGFRNATYNLHSRHMLPFGSGGVNYNGGAVKACTGCHVNPPHGINRQHLIALQSDANPYNLYTYTTAYTPNTGVYIATNCTVVSCHSGTGPSPTLH